MDAVAVTAERLLLVGTSHRRATVGVRERLYIAPHEKGAIALRLAGEGEAVVLATCNRTEAYIADRDPEVARGRVTEEFARRAALTEAQLEPALYVAEAEEVGRHLFRMAAGLDSLAPGEPPILSQVREAHELARQAGAAGPLLSRLFRHALHVGKRVRSETALAERPASLAEAIAAEEAERFAAWWRSLAAVPAIVSLRRRADEIRAAELARANGTLAALSPAQRRSVEAVTAQIVNRLLHEPTVRMKQAAQSPNGAFYAAALRHLFALEEVA